jgi:hypothetical protein
VVDELTVRAASHRLVNAGVMAADTPGVSASEVTAGILHAAGTRIGIAALAVMTVVAVAVGAGGQVADLLPCNPGPGCVRVLFVGNSYTYVNDLPSVFRQLAGSGGHRVQTGMAASGGATLADHAGSSDTQTVIAGSPWQFVVLQEQSEVPSTEQLRQWQMYPAARLLVDRVRAVGAQPVFFVTWAHRAGWPEYGLGYADMQAQIDDGYEQIAGELGVRLAPVGYAWWAAMRQDPQLDLWQDDGSHPDQSGTYLAACVFYAVVFGESPTGLPYAAGLESSVARILQDVAAGTVLGGARY